MKLKGLIDEDTVNYKKTSMVLIFPYCSFKCDKEAGNSICQNSALADTPVIEISKEDIIERYLNNPLTSAIVCGGLEPFDSKIDLASFISTLRGQYGCDDDVVIYTGYTEKELKTIPALSVVFHNLTRFKNIVIKFGRFIPDQEEIFDEILGVYLSSPNQYTKKYFN